MTTIFDPDTLDDDLLGDDLLGDDLVGGERLRGDDRRPGDGIRRSRSALDASCANRFTATTK